MSRKVGGLTLRGRRDTVGIDKEATLKFILVPLFMLAAWFEMFVGVMDLTLWAHTDYAVLGPVFIVVSIYLCMVAAFIAAA